MSRPAPHHDDRQTNRWTTPTPARRARTTPEKLRPPAARRPRHDRRPRRCKKSASGALSVGHRAGRRPAALPGAPADRRAAGHAGVSHGQVRAAARGGVAAGAGVVALIAVLVGFYTVRLTAERDRAHSEAEKSAKVSELMTDLLTGADPYRDRPDPTVRDAARRRRRPRAEGARRRARGPRRDADGHRPRLPAARGHATRRSPCSNRRSRSAAASADRSTRASAQTLNDLGVLMRMNGDAARIGDDAGGIARDAARGSSGDAQGRRRHALGARPLLRQPRQQRARGSARARGARHAARAASARITARPPRAWATSGCSCGSAAISPAPSRCCGRASRSAGRRWATHHPNVGSAMANLGLVVADSGRLRRGGSTLSRGARGAPQGAGRRHMPSLAMTLNNLAYPLREQGKYAEAIAALDEALALAMPARGEDSPTVAHYRLNLARVYVAKGDGAAAEPLLRQALAVAARPRRRRLAGRDGEEPARRRADLPQRHGTLTPSGCCSTLSACSRTCPAPRGARRRRTECGSRRSTRPGRRRAGPPLSGA